MLTLMRNLPTPEYCMYMNVDCVLSIPTFCGSVKHHIIFDSSSRKRNVRKINGAQLLLCVSTEHATTDDRQGRRGNAGVMQIVAHPSPVGNCQARVGGG